MNASGGTTVEVANNTHEGVKGCGKLDLVAKQPGGITKTTTLQRLAPVPNLRSNRFLAKHAAKTSGKEVGILGDMAYLGSGESACCFHVGNSEIYAIEQYRCAAQPAAEGVEEVQQRDVIDEHKILRYPNEIIIRDTAKAVGIKLTGKWEPCEG